MVCKKTWDLSFSKLSWSFCNIAYISKNTRESFSSIWITSLLRSPVLKLLKTSIHKCCSDDGHCILNRMCCHCSKHSHVSLEPWIENECSVYNILFKVS